MCYFQRCKISRFYVSQFRINFCNLNFRDFALRHTYICIYIYTCGLYSNYFGDISCVREIRENLHLVKISQITVYYTIDFGSKEPGT